MNTLLSAPHRQGWRWVLLLLLAVGLYGLLPQLHGFNGALTALRQADAGFVATAMLASLMTFAAAAAVYHALAFRSLPLLRTFTVQLAAMFVNRLLPAGSGAIGTNMAYLRHQRHSTVQAGVVALLNNLLGFAGHMLLLSVTLLLTRRLTLLHLHIQAWYGATLVVLFIVVVFVIRKFAPGKLAQIGAALRHYRNRPAAVLSGLFFSMCITAANTLCVYLCLQAVHQPAAWATCLLALTAGVSAGAAVPTPGGLGGFEAAMYGLLVGAHLSGSGALAGVLLYRLTTFWLPMLLGVAALVVCRRRGWLQPVV